MSQDLRSPQRHVLRQLEGNPTDIDRQARDLVDAAEVMRSVATRLQRLADGTDTVSQAESVDQVRGSAGDVVPGLKKAATRYQMTGDALLAYARELETAQLAIRPKIEDIETKHAAVQTARHVVVRGLDGGPNNLDPPAFDRDGDRARRSDAAQDLATAESELATAWSGFDQVFGVWEEAYDRAVGGIDDAFDAADNNDAWGEDYLALLGYVGAALCVVALFCTGPVALVIGAIGLLVGAVILAITVMKRAKGRGSNADLVWAIVGVVPFVRPLTTAKGAVATLRSTKTTMAGGREAVRRTALSRTPKKTPPTRKNPSRKVPQDRRRGIANRETEKFMRGFEQNNSLWNRIQMNLRGGGHSDVTAFGNFVRANPERAGAGAVEWAANNVPAISTGTKIAVGGEAAGSFAVVGDFIANEHVVAYSEWRNQ